MVMSDISAGLIQLSCPHLPLLSDKWGQPHTSKNGSNDSLRPDVVQDNICYVELCSAC